MHAHGLRTPLPISKSLSVEIANPCFCLAYTIPVPRWYKKIITIASRKIYVPLLSQENSMEISATRGRVIGFLAAGGTRWRCSFQSCQLPTPPAGRTMRIRWRNFREIFDARHERWLSSRGTAFPSIFSSPNRTLSTVASSRFPAFNKDPRCLTER